MTHTAAGNEENGMARAENARGDAASIPAAAEHTGPVKVTMSDPETGRVLEERMLSNDYLVIVNGNRFISGVQIMGRPGRATHMIAVKVAP